MIHFLHTYRPYPVIFQIGSVGFYWYGLLLAAAVLLGLNTSLFLARKYKINRYHLWNLALYFLFFGLLGARLAYVAFYNFSYYQQNQSDILKIWEGGLSIHGALAAGFLALFFYCQKHHFSFWLLADILAPALILGQAIGRWGNYFNQELFGRPTDLPWGIPIDEINRPNNFFSFEYFHPAFLYESLWNFLIFIILFFWAEKMPAENKKTGQIFLIYLILYSLGRFFLEFLRIDVQPIFGVLRLGQIFSLAIIAVVLIVLTLKRTNK